MPYLKYREPWLSQMFSNGPASSKIIIEKHNVTRDAVFEMRKAMSLRSMRLIIQVINGQQI